MITLTKRLKQESDTRANGLKPKKEETSRISVREKYENNNHVKNLTRRSFNFAILLIKLSSVSDTRQASSQGSPRDGAEPTHWL